MFFFGSKIVREKNKEKSKKHENKKLKKYQKTKKIEGVCIFWDFANFDSKTKIKHKNQKQYEKIWKKTERKSKIMFFCEKKESGFCQL